jgi:hypothetical protein
VDVVVSVTAGGWNKWGENFVKRQPQSRLQQPIGASPGVVATKAAILRAITTAGAGGRVIINVGHGSGGGALMPTEGKFELAPGGAMTIAGPGVHGAYVNVFYDINMAGPPSMSDLDHDLKNTPHSTRAAHWKVYQEISTAFKKGRLREVALLTCRVGNSTEFLRKVANDWGVVIRAYRQRVVLTTVTTTTGHQKTFQYFMHLENKPPRASTPADELATMETEIPYSPNDTYLVGPPP